MASKKIFFDIITIIITIMVIAILICKLIGFTPYVVLGSSMEPAYKKGSLIYVKPVKPTEIKVDDTITYVANKNLDIATHRVIEIDTENMKFYTKGDKNETVDVEPVHFSNVIGIPIIVIPYLGYLIEYSFKVPGLYVTILVFVSIIVMLLIPSKKQKSENKGKSCEN